jgi:hypothetical protein
MNNHSIHSADRSTHLKIVAVALIAGIAVMSLGIFSRGGGDVHLTLDRSLQFWAEAALEEQERQAPWPARCDKLRISPRYLMIALWQSRYDLRSTGQYMNQIPPPSAATI